MIENRPQALERAMIKPRKLLLSKAFYAHMYIRKMVNSIANTELKIRNLLSIVLNLPIIVKSPASTYSHISGSMIRHIIKAEK